MSDDDKLKLVAQMAATLATNWDACEIHYSAIEFAIRMLARTEEALQLPRKEFGALLEARKLGTPSATPPPVKTECRKEEQLQLPELARNYVKTYDILARIANDPVYKGDVPIISLRVETAKKKMAEHFLGDRHGTE